MSPTTCLILSITNSSTGLRENKAVVNNEKKVKDFAIANRGKIINIEGFKINSISELPLMTTELTFSDQMEIENLENFIKELA